MLKPHFTVYRIRIFEERLCACSSSTLYFLCYCFCCCCCCIRGKNVKRDKKRVLCTYKLGKKAEQFKAHIYSTYIQVEEKSVNSKEIRFANEREREQMTWAIFIRIYTAHIHNTFTPTHSILHLIFQPKKFQFASWWKWNIFPDENICTLYTPKKKKHIPKLKRRRKLDVTSVFVYAFKKIEPKNLTNPNSSSIT